MTNYLSSQNVHFSYTHHMTDMQIEIIELSSTMSNVKTMAVI